jgi:hypothetical protein
MSGDPIEGSLGIFPHVRIGGDADQDLLEDMEIEAQLSRRGSAPMSRLSVTGRAESVLRTFYAPFTPGKREVIVGATHHKSGTILLHNLFEHLAKVTGAPFKSDNNTHLSCVKAQGPVILHYQNVIPDNIPEIERCYHVTGYRLGYIVRDPVALVVSGYLYHKRSNDCWNACPADREAMRNASLAKGLKMQAGAVLLSTLAEQQGVVDELCKSRERKRKADSTVILKLSDFTENFDHAVSALLGSVAGGLFRGDLITAAEKAAQVDDISRWSASRREAEKAHVRESSEKDSAIELWESHPAELDPEWGQVKDARERLFSSLESCAFTK